MRYLLVKVLLPLVLLATLVISFVLGRASVPGAPTGGGGEGTLYTCPMHPQVALPKGEKCPICFMDLVPREASAGGPGELVLKPEAARLAEIGTAPAELRFVTRSIRMRGRVDFDETRQATISAYVAGRIDKLYVNYTGLPVKAGAPLALLYSPDLLTAQEELLEAGRRVAAPAAEASAFLLDSNRRALESAREKLRLLGLDQEQIEAIEKEGRPRERVRLKAPLAGIVVRKQVREGDYVKTGTPLFRVADLSRLWVRLDAYESDLAWLRYGQGVTITARAWPGEEFKGRISFIDPVLDDTSRTVKLRVVVENARGRLKPGMFVRARVASRLSREGKVAAPELAGKWISPVHPEVVREEPGDCSICGVPLVRAADLGYLEGSGRDSRPLVVPASAVLGTGRRTLVFVHKPGTGEPTYESRRVRLGPRADHYWIVLAGVEPGEEVVVQGNFKLDSAMQLQGKPSLMSAPGGEASTSPRARVGEGFRRSLDRVLGAYFDLWLTLSGDDLAGARESAAGLVKGVAAVDPGGLEYMDRPDWRREAASLDRLGGRLAGAADLDRARQVFASLSDSMARVVTIFGTGGRDRLWRVHCPMAFDNRGGWWLQSNDKIRNPYFGASMLKCGTLVETYLKQGGR